ncbi:MAG: DNA polymerase I [Bacilli bacterium]|nr:DNA polymerase I [Bacilli bacterium]
MKRFMIVDGNSILFRAFYGTFRGDSTSIMRAKNGQATNAIYALANIFISIINKNCPDYTLVAFDSKEKTFRHEKYAGYKAGRKPTPEDLLAQFPLAFELLEDLGFTCYAKPRYEADDIVGSMAELAKKSGFYVEIFSGDRDLLQLIDDNVTVSLTKRGLSDVVVMDKAALNTELGLTPLQITDLKGLMGDASDHLIGVPGVGEKTALKLLHEYGNLETVLANASKIPGKLGEKIINGTESATQSKELATICRDMPFDKPIDDFVYHGVKEDKLREFYKKYDLVSLLKKLPQEKVTLDFDNKIVTKIPSEYLQGKTSLILEMLEDNYHTGTIIGLAVSDGKSSSFIELKDLTKDVAFINYLKDAKYPKLTYDVKRLAVALKRLNIEINNVTLDLPLATYIMEPNLKDDPAAIFDYYNKTIPFIDAIYVRKTYLLKDVAEYAGLKAFYLMNLEGEVFAKLEKLGLSDLYNKVELPLAFILANMEETGVKIDTDFLKRNSNEVGARLTKLEQDIYLVAGETFNINSPSQLAEVLYDKLQLPTNKKRSTSAEQLTSIQDAHPIIPLILEYRRYAKLQSTYLVGLQNYVLSDGKIHTIYNQMLTQTGRLSSKEPNLQNITMRDEELKEVRKAFIATTPGNYIVSFDYSQVELRVLAHLSNDAGLIKAFKEGEDFHSETASKIFNVPLDQVTPVMRRQAKVINFGIVYGMSDWGLASELGIDVKSAKAFIERYFAEFPGVKKYLENSVNECIKLGYTRTILGRYRTVREINDPNYNVREFGKRIAMNTPIQGSAADIIKVAMIKVAEVLKSNHLQAKMILQIHDELVFDVPYNELMLLVPLIEECMDGAMELKVPLKVDCEYGFSWYH